MDKRKKELIFFGAAVLLLVVLAAMTLRGSGGPTTQPQTKQVAKANTTQQGQQGKQPLLSGPITSINPEGAGRDPFAPAIGSGRVPSGRPPQMAPTTPAPNRPSGIPSPSGWWNLISERPHPVEPVTTTVPPAPPKPPIAPKPVKPSDPLILTGVVEGPPSYAIFRQNENRYYVQPGDTVGPYLVRSISAQRVVLALGREQHSLALGGKL